MLFNIALMIIVYFVTYFLSFLFHAFHKVNERDNSTPIDFPVNDYELGDDTVWDLEDQKIYLESDKTDIDYSFYLHEDTHRRQNQKVLGMCAFMPTSKWRYLMYPVLWVEDLLRVIIETKTYIDTMNKLKSIGYTDPKFLISHTSMLFTYYVQLLRSSVMTGAAIGILVKMI